MTLLAKQVREGRPRWVVGSGGGTRAHLLMERDGGYVTSLCGYTLSDPVEDSTARHCATCLSRLRSFFEAAEVEVETVVETYSVTVARPAEAKSLREIVDTALARSRSTHEWPRNVAHTVEPYIEPKVMDLSEEGVDTTEYAEARHVHSTEGRCVKDRDGLCPVGAAQRAADEGSED